MTIQELLVLAQEPLTQEFVDSAKELFRLADEKFEEQQRSFSQTEFLNRVYSI